MKALNMIGRIIFGLAFVAFGVIHLVMGAKFGGEVPSFFQFGSGAFWVYLTGIAYILAAISIFINVKTGLACGLLGGVVFLIAFTVHLPAFINGSGQAALGELINFIKAMAIGGAAWYIAGTTWETTASTTE